MNALLGRLPANVVNQFPSGRWGFVGSVDVRLSYQEADGSQPTPERLRLAVQCGPGMVGLRTRTWDTREMAVQAAHVLGVVVSNEGVA